MQGVAGSNPVAPTTYTARALRGGIFPAIILSLIATASDAALLGRAPVTPGGTNYQAYYDTVLNITWLADANLAATNTFGVSGICTTNSFPCSVGGMAWTTANEWVAAMNAANYLGISNWRLPRVTDTGNPGCNFAYGGTDCGYNVDPSASELAHLYHSTLGNDYYYDTDGNATACNSAGPPNFCLTNTGPFSNLQPAKDYWSGTAYAPDNSQAWFFPFYGDSQRFQPKGVKYRAWAVASGDPVGAIPIPAAAWLFGGALLSLGALRRRQPAAKD